MKRITYVLALGIVASLAAVTFAQDSVMWWDVRDGVTSAGTGVGGQLIVSGAAQPYINGQDTAGGGGNSADRYGTSAINAGGRGAGGVLRLNPVQNGGFHAQAPNGGGSAWPNYATRAEPSVIPADNNSSTGVLYLYMDVNDDPSGLGDVISSIGINTMLSNGPLNVTPRNPIGSVSMVVYNGSEVNNINGVALASGAWNPTPVNGSSNLATPPSIIGTKMVRVPVTTGPVYADTLGIRPTAAGPYRIARLNVTAGTRNCTGRTANAHVDNSTYSVKLAINNLLITRVFSSGGDTVENIGLGNDPYVADAAFGTFDAAVDGGNMASVNTNPDASIQIRLHGDFNGDGNVTATDITGFNGAVSASLTSSAKVRQMYCGDFNNNRTITATDITGFNNAVGASLICP